MCRFLFWGKAFAGSFGHAIMTCLYSNFVALGSYSQIFWTVLLCSICLLTLFITLACWFTTTLIQSMPFFICFQYWGVDRPDYRIRKLRWNRVFFSLKFLCFRVDKMLLCTEGKILSQKLNSHYFNIIYSII